MAAITTPSQPPHKGKQFLTNVLWNWSGVVLNIFTALILSPFIIRRLGDVNYGLWALTSSLAEYYWIVDLGFRSATVKYSAHYRALGENGKVNEILNTGLFYSACIGPLLLIGNLLAAPKLAQVMHVASPLFPKLVMIVVSAWVMGSLFNVFSSCLEGFQRFDLINKIYLFAAAVRSLGTATLLLLGYGVLEMAIMVLIAQLLVHVLSIIAFLKVFPEARFSRRLVKLSALKTMLSYGSHSVVASLAQRLLNQGAPLLIGAYLPPQFVGYYAAPSRLLDYTVDGIGRVGMVSNPNAAEMVAHGERHKLINLSVIANRYSLLLFLPLTIFLSVYGPALLSVWLNPRFAAQASGVLLALLAGITIAQAGQYNSGSILFGMGRHQTYSRALIAEAVLVMGGIVLVVPKFGIVGAALVVSGMMLLNRGLFTAFLLSREIEVGYLWFLAKIYQPILFAIPVALILNLLRVTLLPGRNWGQLILAGTIMLAIYIPVVLLTLRPEHRELLYQQVRRRIPKFA